MAMTLPAGNLFARKPLVPKLNAVGLLPETHLKIMSEALEWGETVGRRGWSLTYEETDLLDYGFISMHKRMMLRLTDMGREFAPDVCRDQARWDRFSEVAPMIALCVADNAGQTLDENNVERKKITFLLLCVRGMNCAKDDYVDSHPDEVAALALAGL